MRIKVGVLPFQERPTLVNTSLPGVRSPRSRVVQTVVDQGQEPEDDPDHNPS